MCNFAAERDCVTITIFLWKFPQKSNLLSGKVTKIPAICVLFFNQREQ